MCFRRYGVSFLYCLVARIKVCNKNFNVGCLIKTYWRNGEWVAGKGKLKNKNVVKWHINCWHCFCGYWAFVVSEPPERYTECLKVFSFSIVSRSICQVDCFIRSPCHLTIGQEMPHFLPLKNPAWSNFIKQDLEQEASKS